MSKITKKIIEKNITSSIEYFGKTTKVYQVSELKQLMKESFSEAKKYILTYFCKSSNGEQIFYYEPDEDYKFNISTIENLNGMVYKSFDKLHKDLIRQWFDQEVDEYFKINSDPRAEKFYINEITGQKFINLSEGFLHKVIKPYSKFSEQTKNRMNIILNHIENVWCSNNKESYKYVISWLSMALTGKKMPTALFLKSGEGTGKSIIVSFIIKFVIGDALGLITSRAGQLLKFNSQILGKILLCLEELPTSTKSEWHSVADYLKDLITGNKIDIERKFQDAVQVLNLISLIILTNNENTIKFGKDVRRYMMCDVSHDNVGNHEYFKRLSEACNDKEVGECFFMYLTEYRKSIENIFDPETIPMTESKLMIKETNSTEIINFIRDIFIKEKRGICGKKNSVFLTELKDLFIGYTNKEITTQKFKASLISDIPILKVIEDNKKGHKIQNISFENLYAWYVKRGFWNVKYDVFNVDSEPAEEEQNDYQVENAKLKEENEQLKKQIEELQKLMNQNNNVKSPVVEQNKEMDDLERDLLEIKNLVVKPKEKTKIKVVLDKTPESSDNEDNSQKIQTKNRVIKKRIIKKQIPTEFTFDENNDAEIITSEKNILENESNEIFDLLN